MALVSPTRTTDPTPWAPLMSYDLTTSPDPLKASPEKPEEPEERGELIIVASRRSGTPADVEWITVKVPAGTMSPDLATNLSSVNARISLNGWTVRLDEPTKEFVFSPAGSHETIGPDTGFTIQLSQIPISRKVGTSPITVTEHSRTGNNAFQDRKALFSVGKFPADFYMREFLPEGDPVIDNGGEITLTWKRSTNATYELLYGDTNLNVTNETTRTITNIKSDTTFYLRGTTGDPTNPATRILYAHITVRRPDLEVGQLTVHGPARMEDDTTFAGGVTVQGRGITVDGPITITGPLTEIAHFERDRSPLAFTAKTAGVVYGKKASRPHVYTGRSMGTGHEEITYTPDATGLMSVQTDLATVEEGENTTFIVPVAKDQTFTIKFDGPMGTGCRFYWLPFGNVADSITPSPENAKEKESESCE
ncbi:hypothetical protein ABT288_12815 [Streptomyces sp. NPDC001093]|uniref:hypothetical protein n=1 Tax=Streptomyces sp. NPDC001093 TaxID=3154376 RepID=UPI00332C88D7